MYQWLNYISSVSILIPLIASLYGYKQLDGGLRMLSWLLIIATTVEITNVIFSHYVKNNIWLINIYLFIEAFIFCFLLGKWHQSKNIFIISMVLFSFYTIYCIYDTFITGTIYDLNGHDKIFKGIILIFLSCYCLIRLSANENIILTTDYKFWIASAILVYSAVTLIVFGTSNYVLANSKYASYYSWVIHSFADIISNFMIATGFICYYRKKNL